MTMVYDKNKCKFMPETERIKPKNGNIQKNHNKIITSQQIIIIIQKKIIP